MRADRIDAVDAAWLHMDRAYSLMIITGLLWFDDPVDADELRAIVRERIVERYPRFRQKVVERRTGPTWVEDRDFDLDLHIHHVALPAPGSREELERFVSDVMSTDLDHSRPLWQLWLVDGYGTGSAIVTRLHHALADGISLAQVLLSMADEPPGAPGRGSADHGPRETTFAERAVRTGIGGARWLRSLGKLLLLPPDRRSLLKGRMGAAKQAAWCDPVPLDDVKATGHALGATVNDVLLSAVAGGVGRYLTARGRPVDRIRAFVPYNLRPLDQPVAPELGNRFGLVLVDLPTGDQSPRMRLEQVCHRMDAIKSSPEGDVAFEILRVIGHTPPIVESLIVDAFGSKGSAVITNVPGPRSSLSVAGCRVAGILSWVPQSGHVGLGISIFSYAGAIVVGVGADRRLVPDPHGLVQAIEAELRLLRDVAVAVPA